jgi:hypothetical protein
MVEETHSSSKTWLASIFQEMFRSMHNQEQDNFDDFRYPEEHRSAFFYDLHARYMSFLVDHADKFHAARGLLEDHASRNLFDKLVLFRLLGHLHVRLAFNNPEMKDLFSIPLWLNSLNCGYRFFLDHYSIHHEETVLYATAAAA